MQAMQCKPVWEGLQTEHYQAEPVWRGHYKPRYASLTLAFMAGQCNGLNQAINYHYPAFQATFPAANPKYFNPDISWENKYKCGAYANGGERFPGAKTVFAWTTDFHHLTATGHRAFLFGAGCTVTLGERRHWSRYATDVGLSFLAYSAGFHLWYSAIVHQ